MRSVRRRRLAPRIRAVQHARDLGSTLIEISVAIVLTGLVILPLLAAVRTGIDASVVNRSAANASTAVIDAADRINRAPQSCDYTVFAQASVQTRGWSAAQASVSHEFFDPIDHDWKAGGCRFASPTADLVQRLTITVTTPDRDVSRSIQVVKSNV